MDDARIAGLKLPIGSGAIESAIRRVVNLRLKGASISWHKQSAEAVLLLRSYYKAGRWNQLEKQVFTTCPSDGVHLESRATARDHTLTGLTAPRARGLSLSRTISQYLPP